MSAVEKLADKIGKLGHRMASNFMYLLQIRHIYRSGSRSQEDHAKLRAGCRAMEGLMGDLELLAKMKQRVLALEPYGLQMRVMDSMPRAKPNQVINPFHFDFYHMGQNFSKHVMIMMANHDTEPAKYMILINVKTGERVRIDFPKSWQ